MRRFLRVAAITVGALVVLVVAIRFLVPAEKWRRLALEQFEKHTGMHATAGSASIQFPWPVGLRLADVSLSDAKDSGPVERLEATADQVVVSANLMSLIRRKPQVNEIRLVEPHVELWLREEATPSASSGSTAESGPGAPPAAKPLEIPAGTAAVLSLLAIENGEVGLHQGGRDVDLQGVDQRFTLQMSEDGRATGTMSIAVASTRVQGAELPQPLTLPSVELAVDLDGNLREGKGSLQVQRLATDGIEVKGPVQWDLSGARPALDAELDLHGDVPTLYQHFGAQMDLPPPWKGQVQVPSGALAGHIRIRGSLPAAPAAPADFLALVAAEGSLDNLRANALGALQVQAKSSWALEGSTFRLTDIEATMPGTRARGQVDLPVLGEGTMQGALTLDLDLEPLRDTALAVVPRLPAEMTSTLPAAELWPEVRGAATAEVQLAMPLGQELDPSARPVVCRVRPGDIAIRPAGFTDSFHLTNGLVVATLVDADVSGVQLSGPGLQGTCDAHASGWPDAIAGSVNAVLQQLDVDALQAALPASKETAWLGGMLVGDAVAAETPTGGSTMPTPPENLTVRFSAQAAHVQTRGYALENVAAEGSLVDRRLDVPKITGKLGTGDLTGDAKVDWTVDPPQWQAKARATTVPAGSLLAPFAGVLAQVLSTDVSGTMQLSGPLGKNPEIVRGALDGEGSVLTTAGKLLTDPILGSTIAEFLGPHAESFRTLDFQKLTAGIHVDEGRVQFDKLVLDGPTAVRASGWVGLTGRCDYRMEIKLPPGVTPQLGALSPLVDFLRDEDRRIRFAVAVSGPAAKPKVQVDTKDLEDRAQAQAKRAGSKELDRILSDQLGIDAKADSSATSPEDQIKEKAEDAVKDLLGGFKKKKDKGGGGR